MGLECTPVSKCLDKKTLIMGFEMPDLLLVFMLLAVLNFLFGQTDQKLLLVWIPPLVLALILKYGKKGKPENYIVHWIRYQFGAGVYSAFPDASESPDTPKTRKRGLV